MNASCEICTHKKCFICRFATPEWKKIITDQKQILHTKKNQQIIFEGSTITGIHFICSGKAKVFRKIRNDGIQIVRHASSGDILGHRGYGSDNTYPISATMLTDGQLHFIPTKLFFEVLLNNPKLSFELMMFYASELKKSETRSVNYTCMNVTEKVADAILMLVDIYGYCKTGNTKQIDVPITRTELAQMTGVRYENILRALGQLTKKNIIKPDHDRIVVKNEESLREICLQKQA